MLNLFLMEKNSDPNDSIAILTTKSNIDQEQNYLNTTAENEEPAKYSKISKNNDSQKISSDLITNTITYEENENDDELTTTEIKRLNKIREEAIKRSLKYKQFIMSSSKNKNFNNINNNTEINNSLNTEHNKNNNSPEHLSEEDNNGKEKNEINPNQERIFNGVHTFLYKDNEPLIVLGPHLNYYILIISLVSFFSVIIYSIKDGKMFFKVLFFFGYLFFVISYTLLMIKNPGIPTDKSNYDLEDLQSNSRQCEYCECIIYKDKYKKTTHCMQCDVCVEGFFKHYPFATKCIGNGNITIFRIWIVSGPVFLVIIFCYLLF